jgi:hypothetical protein
MNLTFDFRAGPIAEALERLVSRVNVLWGKEHDPVTGGHTTITADSITAGDITGDNLILGGVVTDLTDVAFKSVDNIFTQPQHITMVAPRLSFIDTARPVDEKVFRIMHAYGIAEFSFLNDAETTVVMKPLQLFRYNVTPVQATNRVVIEGNVQLTTGSGSPDSSLRLKWYDPAQPVDARRFEIAWSNQTIYFQHLNDAETVPTAQMTFNRSGDLAVARDVFIGRNLSISGFAAGPLSINVLPITGTNAALQVYGGIAVTKPGEVFAFNLYSDGVSWRYFATNAIGYAFLSGAQAMELQMAPTNSGAAGATASIVQTHTFYTSGAFHANYWIRSVADANSVNLYLRGNASSAISQIAFCNPSDVVNAYIRCIGEGQLYFRRATPVESMFHMDYQGFYPHPTETKELGSGQLRWARTSSLQVIAAFGSLSACAYTFEGINNTGLYATGSPGTSGLGFACEGVQMLLLDKPNSTVRVSGMLSTTDTVSIIANPSSAGVVIRGRAGDNLATMFFMNNANTVYHYYIRCTGPDALHFLRGSDGTGISVMDASSLRPGVDNAIYLGYPGYRWVAVYAVNGTINTSDARLKDVKGPTPLGLDFINELNPVEYTWISKKSKRRHGIVAQELKAVLDRLNVEFEGVYAPERESGSWGLNYSELIAPMIKAIQELDAKIDVLRSEHGAKAHGERS